MNPTIELILQIILVIGLAVVFLGMIVGTAFTLHEYIKALKEED